MCKLSGIQWCRKVMKSGGTTFMITFNQLFSRGVWRHAPPLPPESFLYFCALRQLLVQSEAKILIELLNICFIDNTDLVLCTAQRNLFFI